MFVKYAQGFVVLPGGARHPATSCSRPPSPSGVLEEGDPLSPSSSVRLPSTGAAWSTVRHTGLASAPSWPSATTGSPAWSPRWRAPGPPRPTGTPSWTSRATRGAAVSTGEAVAGPGRRAALPLGAVHRGLRRVPRRRSGRPVRGDDALYQPAWRPSSPGCPDRTSPPPPPASASPSRASRSPRSPRSPTRTASACSPTRASSATAPRSTRPSPTRACWPSGRPATWTR